MMKIKKMIIFMYVYIYRCHFGTQFFDNMDQERKQNRAAYKKRQKNARKQGEREHSDLIRYRKDEIKMDTHYDLLKNKRVVENELKTTIRRLIDEEDDESEKEKLKEDLRTESEALRELEEIMEKLIGKVRVLMEGRTEKEDSYPVCPVCFGPAKFVRGCGHMFCESCCDRSTCAVCREENKVSERSLIF